MTRLLPYPLLAVSLLFMWLLLNGFTAGHFLLGAVIALVAASTMSALQPSKPRIRRWSSIATLMGVVFVDILRSNIAVARINLGGRKLEVVSGFVAIPLEMRDPTGLAFLACIITSTPGTAWVEYRSTEDLLLIHVLDLVSEESWSELIKGRYEALLMEIFE
ncbi:Na+/H+ antiporter subunit E [Aquamicrobium sp. NLF2-7]|uniref:Na+/H+ antiporter subunit E n=1 Tax=Aquamicrobium sp. NLF2-7 TaxID=2918753 RepID=UPI001EFB044C|nr:Na+/H+ antiporter subunit E [Aquamicrobium sp. NLF2-7]MCG8271960.1 Na+/H+ antiporter subunit E [Aquamicrobium sp. NLF2-7]